MLFQNVDINMEAGFSSFNCAAAVFDCVSLEPLGDGVGVVGRRRLAKKLGDICISEDH